MTTKFIKLAYIWTQVDIASEQLFRLVAETIFRSGLFELPWKAILATKACESLVKLVPRNIGKILEENFQSWMLFFSARSNGSEKVI